MWGSAPYLGRVDSGLFLTYFEGDASVQQQLLWLREDGSLRHQQAESTFAIRYAYTVNNQCKLVGVESIGTNEWNWCGISVRTYADDGSLIALDTIYSDTLFDGAVLAQYCFLEHNGILWAALLALEQSAGVNHYTLRELRYEFGVAEVFEAWPVQDIPHDAYLFNLTLAPAPQGNIVVSAGVYDEGSWTIRYYGLNTDGQPFGPPHAYELIPSQALTGSSATVYEGTVYGCFTANDLSVPGDAGAFLLGFPADEIISAAGEPRTHSPAALTLSIYPNPFNESARLHFSLNHASFISLDLLDITGRHVRDIASGWYAGGEHSLIYRAEGLPSGMYFCRILSGSKTAVTKLFLIR